MTTVMIKETDRGLSERSDAVGATWPHKLVVANLLIALGLLAGPVRAADVSSQKYPDVISAKVQARDADTFDFDVTVSSPYDTPQRYADAFRITGMEGIVYGERRLLHDHATEQPFTRDLYGVNIPRDVRKVVVQARDQEFGYGGKTVEMMLPGR